MKKEKKLFKYTLYADFYRAYGKNISKKKIVLLILKLTGQGPKFIYYMRLANYLDKVKSKLIRRIVSFHFTRMSYKYGVEISYKTKIGEGLSIPHLQNIVIGENAVIGRNCTILQGTTIGSNLFKARYDLATIGDNVLMGAGCKIIGPVKIGDNVTIGANSVVTKDIPDNVVVAGSPAEIVAEKPAVKIGQDYKSFDEFADSGYKVF